MDARLWGALLVLCGAIFLDGLDVSMVVVALPRIRADLGLSTTSLQWIVSAYVLGYGGFLLLGGRAADLLGRRRMFISSLAVFVAASALGAVVSDGSLLIATRFIKGVSAAFTRRPGCRSSRLRSPRARLATARWASTQPRAPAGGRSGWCSAAS
jgi:MFS family permease